MSQPRLDTDGPDGGPAFLYSPRHHRRVYLSNTSTMNIISWQASAQLRQIVDKKFHLRTKHYSIGRHAIGH